MSLHATPSWASPRPWVVVLPIKDSATAKSRLTAVAGDERLALARAFVTDCLAAVLRSDAVTAVLAVTDDPVAAELLDRAGCGIVSDGPRDGLNRAAEHGAAVARARWPGCWIAVLPSDLPALRPADVDQALAVAGRHARAFVPDAAGVGTNLLTAAPGVPLEPRFEGLSCAAHAASGAICLDVVAPGLRHDVDDGRSLHDARVLGVGPATRAVLAGIDGWCGHYDGLMQATVASYDDQTGSGTVLADDGVELPFAAAALEGSRLRLLRPGQRVRVSIGAAGAVDRLQIVTLSG
ncbi:MAG TPA: 2-phospho-L-lactate guanylyltransferase [Nocardioidaceae bacterium]|nr:2-phospho-L-lactate guanylyltransferase [Nocardioidaceae bacterium]